MKFLCSENSRDSGSETALRSSERDILRDEEFIGIYGFLTPNKLNKQTVPREQHNVMLFHFFILAGPVNQLTVKAQVSQ